MATHPLTGTFPQVRPRRMRADPFSRRLMRETTLTRDDLIQPLFIREDDGAEQIPSMPGITRRTPHALAQHARHCLALGIPAIVLFPHTPPKAKTEDASEAWNPDGLVQRAIRSIKDAAPELGVITDIALDPYTLTGQDGLTDANGYVTNDATVEALVRQALSHIEAGADVVAPSDMMDGRVRAIRDALEQNNHPNARILAYSAKYNSTFYAPFRDAIGSNTTPTNTNIAATTIAIAATTPTPTTDKSTYQMDPANTNEALREAALDLAEGADMIMIKPALPNLDIIWRCKQTFGIPTLAYQVSGEYAMLKAAANNGYLNEKQAVMETLTSIKRAGADAILTYFAEKAAQWIEE